MKLLNFMSVNYRIVIRKILFVCFSLYSLFFFIGSTLAPVFAHIKLYDMSAILTSTYMYSCHQQPDRSFWLLGYPIALCCRCYGFYLGVAISGIFALFDKFNLNPKFIITALFVSLTDIIINYGLGLRLNTGNVTRFIVGILMGMLFIQLLITITKLERKKKNEN